MGIRLRHGSLFSGIGGFDLAAAWMGWDNVFHCEIDPFCRKVLGYHFPKSRCYEDIRTANFREYRRQVDILTGGFPCQPFSVAGKQRGKEDERYMWPDMLRAIREIRPTWVVAENVRGLVSWNGGLVFEEVCTDLETEGYEVLPFIIPAAAVDAPHRRERVWIIAYTERNDGFQPKPGGDGKEKEAEGIIGKENRAPGKLGGADNIHNAWAQSDRCPVAHPYGKCSQNDGDETEIDREKDKGRKAERSIHRYLPDYWKDWPTQPPICTGDDGFPGELAGITFPSWRKESIKAMGNAIVPQVAYEIFKAIGEYMETRL